MSTPCNIVSVVVSPPVPRVVQVTVRRPVGAEAVQCEATAGEQLSSNCYITFNSSGQVIRANASTGLYARGFVKQATASGQRCTVYLTTTASGYLGLNPELPLWLGEAGEVTQTPPTSGVCQLVGSPVSSSRIFVQIQTPFIRS